MSDLSLAPRTRKVLEALTDEFAMTSVIALRAGLPTRSRRAMAEQACGFLVRLGLAESRLAPRDALVAPSEPRKGGAEEGPAGRRSNSQRGPPADPWGRCSRRVMP